MSDPILQGERRQNSARLEAVLSILEGNERAGGDGIETGAVATRLGVGRKTAWTYLHALEQAGRARYTGEVWLLRGCSGG